MNKIILMLVILSLSGCAQYDKRVLLSNLEKETDNIAGKMASDFPAILFCYNFDYETYRHKFKESFDQAVEIASEKYGETMTSSEGRSFAKDFGALTLPIYAKNNAEFMVEGSQSKEIDAQCAELIYISGGN